MIIDEKEKITYVKIVSGSKTYVNEQLEIIRKNHNRIEIEPIGVYPTGIYLLVKAIDFDVMEDTGL